MVILQCGWHTETVDLVLTPHAQLLLAGAICILLS